MGVMRDKRGTSEVIGVTLMVAITVMMAAIVGSFVYGYAGEMINPPLAMLTMYAKENPAEHNYIEIVHKGGDAIPLTEDKLTVYLDGKEIKYYNATRTRTLAPGERAYLFNKTGTLYTPLPSVLNGDLRNTPDNVVQVIMIHRESAMIIAKQTVSWTKD